MPRDFYIPRGSAKVSDKLSDAVAYIYTSSNGKPAAAVFYGGQAKPVARFYWASEAAREAHVRDMFERRRAWLQTQAERRAARKAAAVKLDVGDILHSSWGYEQTNNNFYEVVEVLPKSVRVREVAQERIATDRDCGKCGPLAGSYIGNPTLHRVAANGTSISLGYRHASLYCRRGTVGGAIYWSQYA